MQHEDSSTLANRSSWLPGFGLVHIFHLVSKANLQSAAKIAAHLEHSNVQVNNWLIVRRGNVLDHKIVINEISERSARALRDELVAIDEDMRVRLEHLLIKENILGDMAARHR